MTDLLGGQVDIMCDQTTNTTKQIKGGTSRPTPSRRQAPRRPARRADRRGGRPAEGFEVAIWHGLYAPKGTPAEVDRQAVRSAQDGA